MPFCRQVVISDDGDNNTHRVDTITFLIPWLQKNQLVCDGSVHIPLEFEPN